MKLTTSTRITLRFTLYVSILVFFLGFGINAIVFRTWYTREVRSLDQRALPSPGEGAEELRFPPKDNRPIKRPGQKPGIFPLFPKDVRTVPHNDDIRTYLDQTQTWLPNIHCDKTTCLIVRINQQKQMIGFRDVSVQMTMQHSIISISLIILLLSIGGTRRLGYFFTKQSFRPLLELAKTVRRIQPQDYALLHADGPADDEIVIITLALHESYKKITDHIHVLRDFVAHASHECKTPLATLTACMTMIEEIMSHNQSSPDLIKPSLMMIKKTVYHINDLFDTLLTLTQRESQTVKQQAINLSVLVSDIFSHIPNPKNLTLVSAIGENHVITTDQTMATGILRNLLENAHKYTPAGGTVSITSEQTQNMTTIIISDTGPGIAAEDQEKIRQQFWKKDSNSEGFGIGLYLVKRLCVKLGWQIQLDTGYTDGTQWIVRIPEK